ncbi:MULTISPECIES: nucleoside triphosphate pyrophosphohydrolase, partial [unclassified Wolbachia]
LVGTNLYGPKDNIFIFFSLTYKTVSKTSDENLEELADLLEVIHALGKESGLSIEQIEEKRISKKQERGGFENRIYNTYIEVNPKSIDYYHKKSSDYPEIVVV